MQMEIQLLRQTSDGLVFDTKQLFNILDSIGDRNISIVSITGKQNSGKSLLLNHFVRSFKRNELSKNCDYFENSRYGSDQPLPCGIWMCSKPFVVTASDGSEMVLLLMETRCNIDDERCSECGFIFAISLLLSSTLILNIENNVTEDIMKFVEHFTLFAQLMNDESKSELFQRLVFLVRDWDNECAYRYGYHDDSTSDISNYLKNIIKPNTIHCVEGRSNSNKLLSCFNHISCYLMPHQGKYVSKSFRLIDKAFRENMEEFVTSIVRDLTVKTIGGQKLTVNSLNHYLNKWQQIVSSHLKFAVESQSPLSDVKRLELSFRCAYGLYDTKMLSSLESNPTDVQLMTSHNNGEEEFWEYMGHEIDFRVQVVSDECLNEMLDSFRATIANRYQYYRNKNLDRIKNEAKQLTCNPCIARSVRPIDAVSQKPSNIVVLKLPCPGYYNGSCEREDHYWFCCQCKELLEYGYDGYLYCECGRADVYSFEFKCNSKIHSSIYLQFMDYQLKSLLSYKEINSLAVGRTGAEKMILSDNSTQLKHNSLSISDVLSTGYSRNSFDRFGDDLCEHILLYLSFVDKIRFECVNKQWKRLVFQKQYRLDLKYNTDNNFDSLPIMKILRYANNPQMCHHLINKYKNGLDVKLPNYISYIEPVLRKCANIAIIFIKMIDNQWDSWDENEIWMSAELLMRIITDNCKYLRSFEFDIAFRNISDKTWRYFGQKFGQTLQSITFSRSDRKRSSLLNYCPNLLSISGIYLKNLFVNKDNSVLLPNLVEVRHAVDFVSNPLMDLFVEKYSNIKVFQCHINTNNCYSFLSQISQLNKLEKLEMLEISPHAIDIIEFINGLKKFSCNKQLKYLRLNFTRFTTAVIYIQLLEAINCISSLKYLKINLRMIGENPNLSVKLLENCTQLTHLYIDGISGNTFCTDIQSYLPQIKHFICQ